MNAVRVDYIAVIGVACVHCCVVVTTHTQ